LTDEGVTVDPKTRKATILEGLAGSPTQKEIVVELLAAQLSQLF